MSHEAGLADDTFITRVIFSVLLLIPITNNQCATVIGPGVIFL